MFTASQPTIHHPSLQDQFLGEMKRFCVGEDCPVFNDMYTFCQARKSKLLLYLPAQEQKGLVNLLAGKKDRMPSCLPAHVQDRLMTLLPAKKTSAACTAAQRKLKMHYCSWQACAGYLCTAQWSAARQGFSSGPQCSLLPRVFMARCQTIL